MRGLLDALASIGPIYPVRDFIVVIRSEEDTVQPLKTLALATAAVIAVACAKDSTKSGINNDLKRDLELAASSATDLASAQNAAKFSPTEIASTSTPTVVPVLKKAKGNKVVRSKAPTVKASETPIELAQSDIPEVTVMSQAPSETTTPTPAETNDLPAMPRPTPAQIPVGGSTGEGSSGTTAGSGGGGGIGAVLGGIFGAVIRGGGVDGDRCEPHGRDGRRYPRTIPGGGVYGGGAETPMPTSPTIPRRGRSYFR